jgi:hypothetical protein
MRSDVPLAAGVIAETVGINRSTTRRSINTLIHRPSSTSCQPSTVRQFTSEFRNASASLQRSAAGASTYCESRRDSPGHVVRRGRGEVYRAGNDGTWGGPTCRSGWISRRDRVDTAVGLQHRRRASCARCAQSGRRSARSGRCSSLRHQPHRSAARLTLERVIAAGPRLVEIARQLPIRLGWEPEGGAMRR